MNIWLRETFDKCLDEESLKCQIENENLQTQKWRSEIVRQNLLK